MILSAARVQPNGRAFENCVGWVNTVLPCCAEPVRSSPADESKVRDCD